MYKVHIYCRIPSGIELTNDNISSIKWKGYVPNGVTVKEFKTWDGLLYYVTRFQYTHWQYKNEYRNHFLDATMCNPSDSCRHSISFGHNETIWNFGDYVVGYLVKDDNGKVIDLRNYKDEVIKFDRKAYKADASEYESYERRWALREERWETNKRLLEGKPYWRYYRQICTTNERRAAFNEDAKGLIRGKRRVANLPHSWDDLHFYREKTWKARTKVKRQWEVNLPKHIDTTSVKGYDEDDSQDSFDES